MLKNLSERAKIKMSLFGFDSCIADRIIQFFEVGIQNPGAIVTSENVALYLGGGLAEPVVATHMYVMSRLLERKGFRIFSFIEDSMGDMPVCKVILRSS